MERIATSTLGCKVNFADTQTITALLPLELDAPVKIVGTCCVTAAGEKQSRKEVRRAAREVGGGGTVFVTGCAARINPDSFATLADNVKVLTGEPGEIAAAIMAQQPPAVFAGTRGGSASGRTRFFLKVQDGCANRCSYCVVPLARGGPRSIGRDVVMAQAREQVDRGFTELVVSGINVGAYDDGGFGLPRLLEALADIEGLAQLRLSSIEATDLTPELLEVIGGNDRIAGHLHVPLQSGDDGVLAAMKRRYRIDDLARLLDAARAAIPSLNLTTDVMVGFPAEDDRAFRTSLAAVEELGFTRAHVFSFSPRPGTAAAAMGDPVTPVEKRSRSSQMRELSQRLQREHQRRKLGQASEVLLESATADGLARGYSSDYTRFLVPGGNPGRMTRVVAERLADDGIIGKVVAGE